MVSKPNAIISVLNGDIRRGVTMTITFNQFMAWQIHFEGRVITNLTVRIYTLQTTAI